MYIGRFAPSPTGPLHFGSLIAAVASYLEAKAHNGQWLVRMEDIDRPREMPGAADGILHTLEAFGFEWHGEVIYQSRRTEMYAAVFEQLKQDGHVYPCSCSRKEIADSAVNGIEGLIYPGTCRYGMAKNKDQVAWRVKVDSTAITFTDGIQGPQTQRLADDIGDFVLKRADGLYAYQLATVIDDAAQQVTHIVRGADLLNSTPRQIFLQDLLHYAHPVFAHVPVAVNAAGEKLSKQTLAAALDVNQASSLLHQALLFLGQQAPEVLRNAELDEFWAWAHTHWQLAAIPKRAAIPS